MFLKGGRLGGVEFFCTLLYYFINVIIKTYISSFIIVYVIVSLVLFYFDRLSFGKLQTISPSEKRKVPFSMAIGHGELKQECFQFNSIDKKQNGLKCSRKMTNNPPSQGCLCYIFHT